MSDSESGSRSQSGNGSTAQYEEGSNYADVLTGMSNSVSPFQLSQQSTQSNLSATPGLLAPDTFYSSKGQQHIYNPSAAC